MAFHKLQEPEDNFRTEEAIGDGISNALIIVRDFVPPVPVGSYVACVFRIAGYTPDSDGSAMAVLEQVDKDGDATGWTQDCIGLYENTDVVLDGPRDLHDAIEKED